MKEQLSNALDASPKESFFIFIACPDPPLLPNGVVKNGSRSIGSKRTYVCLDGYQPIGKPRIKCENDSTWTTLEFSCNGRYLLSLSLSLSHARLLFLFLLLLHFTFFFKFSSSGIRFPVLNYKFDFTMALALKTENMPTESISDEKKILITSTFSFCNKVSCPHKKNRYIK